MANTSSRTLRLLSLLQTHRYWPGPELADRLGVSPRTLRRDVDRLRELGYPVHAQRGLDGGYQLAAGAALPPLVVDDEEAVALVVGLHAAAGSTVSGVGEASLRALAKVVQVMPARLRRRAEALRVATTPAGLASGPPVDPAVLTALAQGCRDQVRLRFSYTARAGERSERHVEPHGLVVLGQRWYLVAYDLTRHDWRSFRLDRLTGPLATAERFRPRPLPAEDAAAYVRASTAALPAAHEVDVVVTAGADVVRAAVGRWAQVEELPPAAGGSPRTRVRMTVDDLSWPALAVGSLGAEFEVVSPPELLEVLADWSARFARAAGRS